MGRARKSLVQKLLRAADSSLFELPKSWHVLSRLVHLLLLHSGPSPVVQPYAGLAAIWVVQQAFGTSIQRQLQCWDVSATGRKLIRHTGNTPCLRRYRTAELFLKHASPPVVTYNDAPLYKNLMRSHPQVSGPGRPGVGSLVVQPLVAYQYFVCCLSFRNVEIP